MNPIARRRTDPEPISRYERSMCNPDNLPLVDWAALWAWTAILFFIVAFVTLAAIGFLDVCQFIRRHLQA